MEQQQEKKTGSGGTPIVLSRIPPVKQAAFRM